MIIHMIQYVCRAQLRPHVSCVILVSVLALSGCQQIQDRFLASFVVIKAPAMPAVSATRAPVSVPVDSPKPAAALTAVTTSTTAATVSVSTQQAAETSTPINASLNSASRIVPTPPTVMDVLTVPSRPATPKPPVNYPPQPVVTRDVTAQSALIQRQKTPKTQSSVRIQVMKMTPAQQAIQQSAVVPTSRNAKTLSADKVSPRTAVQQMTPTRSGVPLVDEEGNILLQTGSPRNSHSAAPIDIQN